MARALAVSVLVLIAVVANFGTAGAADKRIAKLPLALICDGERGIKIAYLNEVTNDGTAVYLTSDKLIGARVAPNGKIEPTATMRQAACFGTTMEQLKQKNLFIPMPR